MRPSPQKPTFTPGPPALRSAGRRGPWYRCCPPALGRDRTRAASECVRLAGVAPDCRGTFARVHRAGFGGPAARTRAGPGRAAQLDTPSAARDLSKRWYPVRRRA